jgi:hypothetical protein
MIFFRKIAKYIQYCHKRNQDIIKELETQPVWGKISNYKNECLQHVHRMRRSGLPSAIMKHQSAGKRNPGRPLKRLLVCYIEAGAELKA